MGLSDAAGPRDGPLMAAETAEPQGNPIKKQGRDAKGVVGRGGDPHALHGMAGKSSCSNSRSLFII